MLPADYPMFGLPRLEVHIPPWRPPNVCNDAPFYPLFTERRWLPHSSKGIDPLPEYDIYNFDGLEHKYGIPITDLIADVGKFMRGTDNQGGTDVVLKKLKKLHTNYKFMENNILRRREIIRKQIIDNKISMKILDCLDAKLKNEETASVIFKATEHVYMRAKIPPNNEIITHMGANLYLPYRVHQTWSFLWQNDKNLFKQIYKNEQDLQFIYNQIITTEINMSKLYNWEVKRRVTPKTSSIVEADISDLMDDLLDFVMINMKIRSLREISLLLEQFLFSSVNETITEKANERKEVSPVMNKKLDLVEEMPTTTREGIEPSLSINILSALKEKCATFKKMFTSSNKKKSPTIMEETSAENERKLKDFLHAMKKIDELTSSDLNLNEVKKKTSEIEEIKYELENIMDDVKSTSLFLEAKIAGSLNMPTSSIPTSSTTDNLSTTIGLSVTSPELSVLGNELIKSNKKLSSALKELLTSMKMLSVYKEKLEEIKSMLDSGERSGSKRRYSITMSNVDLLTLPMSWNESK